MIKMLFFDLKESEKKYFEDNYPSDFDIKFFKESLNEDTKLTVKECDETVIISVYTKSLITQKVLEKFKNIRLISIRSNNYENVDIKACKNRNIAVVNISDSENTSVAQYVLGTIFMQARNINKSISDFKNKINRYEEYEGRDISKLSIGIIGTGIIGTSVCKLANLMKMKIYAYDITPNKDLYEIAEYLPLVDLLRKSDIVTLHLPYNKDLYHFISEKELEIMKETAVLINTSHGKLVDTIALCKAIKNKKIKGAVLDVIECENNYYNFNLKNISKETSLEILLLQELLISEKAIITPSISQNTTDSVNKKLEITFNNIKEYFKGGRLNRVD